MPEEGPRGRAHAKISRDPEDVMPLLLTTEEKAAFY